MNSLEKHQEKNFRNIQRFIPMLMSTPMVNAIQHNAKTETRRIIKYSKKIENPKIGFSAFTEDNNFEVRGVHENGQYGSSFFKLKAKKGDIIWVRETWQLTDWEHPSSENYGYIYKASSNGQDWEENTENWKWKPSIFMPKSACRLFLEITNVKIERLQDITTEAAINEGIKKYNDNLFEDYEDNNMYLDCAIKSFKTLWQSINGPESWGLNPYVFVYQFKKIEKPLNFN